MTNSTNPTAPNRELETDLAEALDALDALANPPLLQRIHHTRIGHAGRTKIVHHNENCPGCAPAKVAREILARHGR